MKSSTLKSWLILTCVTLSLLAPAQRPRRNTVPPVNPTPVTDTIPRGFGNLPFIIDSSVYQDNEKFQSQRPDPFGPDSQYKRIPLPYENLRVDDALFAHKVWRELDLREKMNQVFRYDAADDKGSQLFVSILLNAIQSGKVQAFTDDRFTTILSPAEINETLKGQLDTFPHTNDRLEVDAYIVTREKFNVKSITKLRLMEQWIFDRESCRMFVRILGIGLLKTEYYPGTKKERGTSLMGWLYYPDLRPLLANYEVYNPKNMRAPMTWEELFESRMFSSYIVKTTMDNPSNKYIKSYIKDPILALLEGERVKEKIFNYEQDLWSY